MASTFDKNLNTEYSTKEERLARFKSNIQCAKETRKKSSGYRKGKIVINDGKVMKVYDADLPIPEGWERGEVKRSAE